MRALHLAVSAILLSGCGERVCGPEPDDPNGYCELDEDCAETDFCLHEWCDGPECQSLERCFPRVSEGERCTRDGMCARGLACVASPDPDNTSGECSPSEL